MVPAPLLVLPGVFVTVTGVTREKLGTWAVVGLAGQGQQLHMMALKVFSSSDISVIP